MSETIVIAGAGHAAGQVVTSFRQQKYPGKLVLLGDEPYLPYQRPPLSKKYLSGGLAQDRLLFKPASFYEDDQLDVRLKTRVTDLSLSDMTVRTADGDSYVYDKLILALGSRARQIILPGTDLTGVHYLRGIDDVNRLRRELAPGKRMVIIGAGYIGLEVAAVCRSAGLDVTVVEMADRAMSRVVSPQISEYYQRLHEQHGVRFQLSAELAALHGAGSVESVELVNGESIPADLVLLAAGIVPNIELAQDAGLSIDNGIAVDDRCRSSDSSVYAIGDCSSHPNSIYGRRLRLESVHNALEQAKTAVSNICGIEDRYSQVPWFWSDQYDVKLQIAGLSQDYDDVVLRGNPVENRFSCFYLRAQRLIAVDAINSPKEFMRSKTLIADKAIVDPVILAEPESDLTQAVL